MRVLGSVLIWTAILGVGYLAIGFSSKPPEVFGVALGVLLAAASVLAAAGWLLLVMSAKRMERLAE